MKKMLCLALALVMALSLAIPAMAAVTNNSGGTTTAVTYDASNPGEGGSATQENWIVTVPATMAPGGSSNVSTEGNWSATRKLVVSIDGEKKVAMVCGTDSIDLAITFAGISRAGSNTAAMAKEDVAISIADWLTAPLFGTWTGTINYTAAMQNV